MRHLILFITLAVLIRPDALHAQQETTYMGFDDFMQFVLANNLELMVEEYEVSAAEAVLLASRVWDDPELEMIFPPFEDDEFSGFPKNISFEMEIPVDFFGVRRNRVRQARAEKYAAEAGLEDFLRYLRADAAGLYVDMITKQRILERMEQNLGQLNQLAEVNQTLFENGEVGEVDVLQTRLEARNFEAELYDAKADFSDMLAEVYVLMGGIPVDSIVFEGVIEIATPMTSYEQLRQNALEKRPDVIRAQRHQEAAHYAMRKARRERFPEISLIAGYHNEAAISPAPGFDAAYAGLIIPLKFSGFNRGAIQESRIHQQQAELLLKSVNLEVDTELKSAWEKFLLLSQKRLLFTESILEDAERVRDAITYSYQRGEVSLLEALDAQRTFNEVYMNYYDTLAEYAAAIINLSAVSGKWLVDFE